LLKTEKGNLCLQLWNKKIETPSLNWKQEQLAAESILTKEPPKVWFLNTVKRRSG